MIFKDRKDAGLKLAQALKIWLRSQQIKPNKVVVLSLLRGGWPIGQVISEKLDSPHLAIAAAKIGVPLNEEVALGAACFDTIYFNQKVINQLKQYFDQHQLELILKRQLAKAQKKNNDYIKRFRLDPDQIKTKVKNKLAIVVDDGVATGATAKAATLFLKKAKAKQVVLASPVAPADLDCNEFDDCVILIKDPDFQAVGQYYQDFNEVKIS